jgi:uncharacterized glyoxalase superfamily protein PhnB
MPVLVYPDVRKAVDWLCEAFGFTERLQIGKDHRSQLNVGKDGAVILGSLQDNSIPSHHDEVTHEVMVRIEDVKLHCEHARQYGAKIIKEPKDYMYGERQYTVKDLAGHQWTFTESIRDVDPAEWGGILRSR